MTSLTEVYDGTASGVTGRRLYAGTALVVFGAALAVVAVLVATTDLFGGFAADISGEMAARFATVRAAGILAGLSVPTILVGVFVVLPAGRRVQATAAISASLCLLGVALFWQAYPQRWRYGSDQLTLEVSVIYLLGLLTAIWCLFAAVATFKRRNDPGGMLQMNVTRHNKTVVNVDDEDAGSSGFGGIGFLGGTPDGDVDTQTNADDGAATANADRSRTDTTLSYDEGANGGRSSRTGRASGSGGGSSGTGSGSISGRPGVATSDGGSAAADITSPLDTAGDADVGDGRDAEIVESSTTPDTPSQPTDRYCGNCKHFEYVRSSEGMVPYCARHDRAMDDMDACQEWTPNNRR
ncbi:DUF7139 domain-containing protein [Natrinema salifodinae]|uniref:Uncharacterized protein n=1 Tax=Natrinema salifodinae TaxID=1202768 RepID=A0A1I0M493_9EURY|nr:hypothetical protein [Natrinema salifodinae]SEV83099.1 hypothetical protein SAMN05216285_0448 [Natrinema salifodinae]